MGWFTPNDARHTSTSTGGGGGGFSSNRNNTNPTSFDGTYIAPDRTARKLCWEGRDAFFKCLDAHGIIDSIKQDDAARGSCGKQLARFERDCVDSWVTYFKKERVMEYQRDMTLKRLESEGAKTIDTTDEKHI